MALSTGKKIASGICFGRKVSNTTPRNSARDDNRFKNCNRLGCSIKHIFPRGTEVSPKDKLHIFNKTPPRLGHRSFKDHKKAASSMMNATKKNDATKKLKKESESQTQIGSEQECLKLGGPSSGSTREPSKRSVPSMKLVNWGKSSSPSSRKTNTPNNSSDGSDSTIGSHGLRKLEFLSTPSVDTSGSDSTSADYRKAITSKSRDPTRGMSSSRVKGVVGSSSGMSNASERSRMSTDSSNSQLDIRAFLLGNSRTNGSRSPQNRAPSTRAQSWEETLVQLEAYTSLSSQNNTSRGSNSDPSQGLNNDTSQSTNCLVSSNELSEALHDLNRMPWESLYLQMLAFEAGYMHPRTWHDQHRDMRLDIDNMTYEELLALGDKIGTVSTALTEEALSKCVNRSIYKPPKDKINSCGDDEVKCTICQEEYVVGDEVGNLSCNHLYHVDCIHEWFKLKNWCPICKSSPISITETIGSVSILNQRELNDH